MKGCRRGPIGDLGPHGDLYCQMVPIRSALKKKVPISQLGHWTRGAAAYLGSPSPLVEM